MHGWFRIFRTAKLVFRSLQVRTGGNGKMELEVSVKSLHSRELNPGFDQHILEITILKVSVLFFRSVGRSIWLEAILWKHFLLIKNQEFPSFTPRDMGGNKTKKLSRHGIWNLRETIQTWNFLAVKKMAPGFCLWDHENSTTVRIKPLKPSKTHYCLRNLKAWKKNASDRRGRSLYY